MRGVNAHENASCLSNKQPFCSSSKQRSKCGRTCGKMSVGSWRKVSANRPSTLPQSRVISTWHSRPKLSAHLRPLKNRRLSPCRIVPVPFSCVPMGSKRLDSISDYSRHGFNLRVVCQGCGRAVVLDSLALSMARSKAGKSRDMLAVERDLRCRVCGSRHVKCGPVELLPGE